MKENLNNNIICTYLHNIFLEARNFYVFLFEKKTVRVRPSGVILTPYSFLEDFTFLSD